MFIHLNSVPETILNLDNTDTISKGEFKNEGEVQLPSLSIVRLPKYIVLKIEYADRVTRDTDFDRILKKLTIYNRD